jgi:3-oxoacyl-[acyl-carrier protein] reductase
MSVRLTDKSPRIALVTGGAGGIGRAVCQKIAAQGMRVLVVDVRAEEAAEVAASLGERGWAATGIACDVTNPEAVVELRDGVLKRDGTPSVLVNLAGTIKNDVIAKIQDEDLDATIATHVKGTLAVMRAFIPSMKARKYGRIVNTSSIAARGAIGGGSYGAAKGAIEALSRSAALELARHGITVNCVAPGLIETGLYLTTPQEFREKALGRIPMNRLGTPEDVAACFAFLASEGARYVTGQTLIVCGGLSIGF